MLQRMRDRISGWIAGVIIALVAGAFLLFGVEYYFEQSSGTQGEAAKVNGVVITENQVNQTFSTLQQQMAGESHGQTLSSEMTAQLKSYALQSLVSQTALFTTLKKEDFLIGLAQVKAMIATAPEFQEGGQFSETKFMQTLYQNNLSPAEFFQRIQSEWLINQVTSGVAASAFALPTEVGQWYGLQNQERAFGYMIVPMQSFLSQVKVTDQDIKQYYDTHTSEFQTPAKVNVAYLLLSPKDIEKNITVTDSEAEQYYQAHLMNYQVPERWQVMQITVPLASNAPADVAQKAESKAKEILPLFEQGKDTGFSAATLTLSAAQVGKSLQTVLSQLTAGKVSSPIRTPNGYTLLKMVKVMPAETHSFASVKPDVINLIKHQKASKTLSKLSGELADLTYTNPDSLTAASKALQLPIQTSNMMTKAGEKTGLFSDPNVLNAVFSDSIFQSGNNSSPITLSDGSQVVLRVLKKENSVPLSMLMVHDQIEQKIKDTQAAAKAGLMAYDLQNKLASGANPETLAQQNGLQWHEVPLMMRNKKSTVPADVVSTAFSIPLSLKNAPKPLGVQATSYQHQNYVVVAVEKVQKADAKKASATETQQLSAQLSVVWGQLMQHAFVDSVINSATIVIKH